jgi:hypothetical protein
MKRYRNRLLLFIAITVAGIIGVLKGEEAKQKWVFKIRSKYDNKKYIAERKSIAKKGGVLLDEIEMASFHRS